jgi:hypothetical protein
MSGQVGLRRRQDAASSARGNHPLPCNPVTGEPDLVLQPPHSSKLRLQRESIYGAERLTALSQINKSDMFFETTENLRRMLN